LALFIHRVGVGVGTDRLMINPGSWTSLLIRRQIGGNVIPFHHLTLISCVTIAKGLNSKELIHFYVRKYNAIHTF